DHFVIIPTKTRWKRLIHSSKTSFKSFDSWLTWLDHVAGHPPAPVPGPFEGSVRITVRSHALAGAVLCIAIGSSPTAFGYDRDGLGIADIQPVRYGNS